MGENIKNPNTFYYGIIAGKVVRKVAEGTPNAVSRTNKNGQLIWELRIDSLSGHLDKIETRDGDYGKQLIVTLSDKEGTYILQVPYSGSHSKTLLLSLPNINLSKEVEFSPYSYEKDGKTKTGMWINQSRTPIKWFYTKDNPNGMPQMTQVTVKGNKVWDDTDQMAFLIAEAEKTMAKPQVHADEMVDGEPLMNSPEYNDDLPF